MRSDMFYGDTHVFSINDVVWVKYDQLATTSQLIVAIDDRQGGVIIDTVTGFGGQELMYRIRPSALEGKRFKWRKHMWAVHNLIGHPLMQVLAWCRWYQGAMWIHDITTPHPINASQGNSN